MGRPKKTIDKGYMRLLPDGRWSVDIRKMSNGVPFRRATIRATYEDARDFRDAALLELESAKDSGKALPKQKNKVAVQQYTLQSWCEHCLTNIMPNQATARGKPYASKTLDGYLHLLRKWVYPVIGSVPLAEVDVMHMDSLMASIPTLPNKKNCKIYLSVIFQMAETRGHRPKGSNPTKEIKVASSKRQRTSGLTIKSYAADPKHKQRILVTETAVPDGLTIVKVRPCTFEEEAAILRTVQNHPEFGHYYTLILLGLKLGLRIGEALGLDWSAIDFEAGTVKIRQQAQYERGKGIIIRDVKSDAGFRVIPMPKSLAAHLKAEHEIATSPHVVCNRQGYRRDASKVATRIKSLVIEAGVNDYVDAANGRFIPRPTYHDFRRTMLTKLATGRIAPGVTVPGTPLSVLIRISGHEEVTTLASYYLAADDDAVAAVMAQMP